MRGKFFCRATGRLYPPHPLDKTTLHIILMKIYVNDKETEFGGQTVAELVAQLGMPLNGVAVAIGMDIVPRAEWDEKKLAEGDKVMIIRAASGG